MTDPTDPPPPVSRGSMDVAIAEFGDATEALLATADEIEPTPEDIDAIHELLDVLLEAFGVPPL